MAYQRHDIKGGIKPEAAKCKAGEAVREYKWLSNQKYRAQKQIP